MNFRIYKHDEWEEIDTQKWTDLAESSVAINPFYEHWNLLPALKYFANDDVWLITIESSDAIHALMPVVATKSIGFSGLKTWKHGHCFLNTPLFRSIDVLKLLIGHALRSANVSFIRLENYDCNIDDVSNRPLSTSVFSRASQSLDMSWEDFLSGHSKRRRKEYRRNLNKAAINDVQYSESSPCDTAIALLREFMQLEGAGWKGRNNSAIQCNERVQQYYLDVVEQGWALRKLQFQKLTQKDRLVASSIRYVSRKHCFEVKVCFDEKLRHLSPGVVLELLNLKSMLQSDNLVADSCYLTDDGILARMWLEKTILRSTAIFHTSAWGQLANLVYGSWRTCKYRS